MRAHIVVDRTVRPAVPAGARARVRVGRVGARAATVAVLAGLQLAAEVVVDLAVRSPKVRGAHARVGVGASGVARTSMLAHNRRRVVRAHVHVVRAIRPRVAGGAVARPIVRPRQRLARTAVGARDRHVGAWINVVLAGRT